MDYGDGNDTVEKLLKKMHDALDGDLAEHSVEEVDDIKIHVYTFKNRQQGNPFKHHWPTLTMISLGVLH